MSELALKVANAVVLNQQNCGNCKFWYATERVCRRNPPTPVALATPKGILQQSIFPGMNDNGWCGEWRTKLAI